MPITFIIKILSNSNNDTFIPGTCKDLGLLNQTFIDSMGQIVKFENYYGLDKDTWNHITVKMITDK